VKYGDHVTSRRTGAHGKIVRVYKQLMRNGDQSVLVAWFDHHTELDDVPVIDRLRSSELKLAEADEPRDPNDEIATGTKDYG
jgi:hypothetical protein